MDLVITAIVAAVRAGDDDLIRELLPRLAACADAAALYTLRDALADDLPGRTAANPPCRARPGEPGTAGHR